ncbi:hypothetical protein V866_007500 [Kwoniella sp. B9012]|uniref:Uncharacterized protein n=1 Tax=Kwoniella europaea PYCC6329 TaxID=1423913 RepID=A0AAX4KNC4_9TREE
MNDFFESIENLTVLTTVKSVNCNSPWRYRSVNDLRNLKKVTVIMIHNKMENHKLALDNFASTALRRLCQNKSIHSIRVVNLDKVPCGYWNPITGVIDDELIKSLENHDRIKDPFLLDSFHTSEIWDEEAWDISDSEEMRVQKMVIEEGKRQLGKIELLSAQEYLGLEDSRGVLEMEEIKALLGDI